MSAGRGDPHLIGTLITAFWLIPEFETEHIVIGGSAVLILLGLTMLVRHRARWAGAAIFFLSVASASERTELPKPYTLMARASSLYGLVEVIEDTSQGVRYLRSDHSVIGAHWTGPNRSSAFAFPHLMEVLPVLRPDAKDMLLIGLGTGSLPSALARNGIRSDVVEIDPIVVSYAERYFDFKPTGAVYVDDARTLLQEVDSAYDLIVHDTFTGGSTPEHLLSAEVMRRLHQLLRADGVLAVNMVGYHRGPSAAATWALARTLRAEFPVVRAYRDRAPDNRPDETANVIFFASDAGLDFEIPASFQFNDPFCARLLPTMKDWELLQDVPPGEVITDERNPLTRLQLVVAEQHYEAMNRLLPIEVWIR